jgi:hypothetical protein
MPVRIAHDWGYDKCGNSSRRFTAQDTDNLTATVVARIQNRIGAQAILRAVSLPVKTSQSRAAMIG